MKVLDKVIFDCEVSERKILLVPVNSITATPYNPASRTKEGAKLKKLVDSIKKFCVIQPLVITSDRDLVDGNRRLAAAKLAGMETIECIILPPEFDQHEVFGSVNTTAEKIGGRGWLEACRHGYRSPPADILAKYQELFKLVGTYGIDMMIEKKLGFGILTQCKEIRSTGLAMRLDTLIIRVAERKLTNKINFIYRSDLPRAEKVAQLEELLA